MSFNSIQFLIFFPVVVLLYYIVPNKIRNFWLLAASYYFYMCWNAKYALLILASTIITYVSGLLIEKLKTTQADEHKRDMRKKSVVAASFVLNLGILFYFKYTNFAFDMLYALFARAHIQLNMPRIDVLLPVGISFYTFQALSYTMDVYRGEIRSEKNFFRYALFVSFFPQLVAGPIERSKNLLKQLQVPHKFSLDGLREGVLLMIWGFFIKLVIADRIAVFVDTVYGDYINYPGYYLVVATVLFAFQIYCDFAGYSTIAMGTAKILGIQLMDNFNSPYFATSVAAFWRRWHISLTSWFKDYLYIPMGGSRKGKIKKYINIMIVFLVSGLWHGASLSYVIWGGLNGIYQITGEMLWPVRSRITKLLGIQDKALSFKLVKCLFTFVLVDFSWIFFRADRTREAVEIIRQMFSINNQWILFDGSLYECGLGLSEFWLMVAAILVLAVADLCKYRGIVIRNVISKQDGWFRYIFIATAILIVMTFGKYGPAYDYSNFIYFQF